MSKHIYVGTQRIVSKLCDAGAMADPTAATKATYIGSTLKYADKYKTLTTTVKARYDSLGVAYNGTDKNGAGFYKSSKDSTSVKYYYHSDHLGSANYITDETGSVSQHLEYIPYGETFVDERYSTWHSPYKFNGKERDEETGLTYYSQRYFDGNVWLSVDPLAHKYPNVSSYVYCMGNPVKYVDPDGKKPSFAEAAVMSAHVYGGYSDKMLIGGWKVSNRNFGIKLNTPEGLRSQVYERTVNGKTEYDYVTAGSVTRQDWVQNAAQPVGASSEFAQSANNAKILSEKLGSTELTFSGHSQGGAEAALNSLVTDRNAITFNAAGVSDATKVMNGGLLLLLKSESKIDAVVMATDPLNIAQTASPLLPDVNGNVHLISPKDGASTFNGHSIDNILKNSGVNTSNYLKPQGK